MHSPHRAASTGLVVMLALGASATAAPDMRGHGASHSRLSRETDVHDAMRKLWADHVMWTRLYIVSEAANLPDKEATTQRLLRNQDDIGNAMRPFYGDAAGDRLTALLREHILVAAELVSETKAGDSVAAAAADRKWRANAEAIATFLSEANPVAWPLDTLRSEMAMHLDLTRDEATARLEGRFADDIRAYDSAHGHALRFADMLSNGLLGQPPGRQLVVVPFEQRDVRTIELVGPTRGP